MPFLSVVIPAYNEQKRLPKTLRSIARYIARSSNTIEVIVVDDGSTDNTVNLAQRYAPEIPHLRVIALSKNHGKGHAVQQGVFAAKGKYILFMDADNSTPISEVEKLLPYITTNQVVIGSRATASSDILIAQPWYRRLLGRVGNLLIRTLAVKGIQDTQCGFKLFRHRAAKQIFKRLQIMRFGFDMEILSIAQNVLGYKIKEVGVSWIDAPGSKVHPIRDGRRTLQELFRIAYNLFTGQYQEA